MAVNSYKQDEHSTDVGKMKTLMRLFSYLLDYKKEVAFHVTVILFCMYSLNWKLAILPTLCMIFCAVLAILMENRLGTIYEEISEENAKLNTVAEENLAGVRTVKAFAREKFEIKKFLSHN